MNATNFPPLRLAWTIWSLGALLYTVSFYQRVAPGVMTGDLMAEFALSGAALGNLSAFYFYSYVAMQIPTGVIADRWGPRRLLTLGASIAGIGTLLFALAPDIRWANAGRLLIGASVAVGFVSILKLAGHWFAPRQFALASGVALIFGMTGAVFAGVPLSLLIDAYGWRNIMLASAVVTLLIAVIIWLYVRDDPADCGYASYAYKHSEAAALIKHSVWSGIREVLRYRNTWLLYVVPGGVVGTVTTFGGLWGVPFLTTHYGLDKTTAAGLCSALLLSWALGSPIIGWLSDHLGHRKPLYILGCSVLLIGWSVICLVPGLPLGVLIALLILVGLFSSCMNLGFAFVRESTPPSLSGTATGVVNMGVMMGPMLLQPGVGWMLDRFWDGQIINGARLYGFEAFRAGFALMLIWLALSLLLVLFTRETHCRQAV